MTTARRTRRLINALLETTDDMRHVGVIDAATYEKIMLRHLSTQAFSAAEPVSAAGHRFLRKPAP